MYFSKSMICQKCTQLKSNTNKKSHDKRQNAEIYIDQPFSFFFFIILVFNFIIYVSIYFNYMYIHGCYFNFF